MNKKLKTTFEYSYVRDGNIVYKTLIDHRVDIISDFELPGAARSRITIICSTKEHMYNTLYDLNSVANERVSLVRYKYIK